MIPRRPPGALQAPHFQTKGPAFAGPLAFTLPRDYFFAASFSGAGEAGVAGAGAGAAVVAGAAAGAASGAFASVAGAGVGAGAGAGAGAAAGCVAGAAGFGAGACWPQAARANATEAAMISDLFMEILEYG